MAKVTVRNGDVDGALRTLKQKNAREGLQKKARERQEGYKKPGVRRREKKAEGTKNTRKRERNNR
jgi:ribosomal protein S21